MSRLETQVARIQEILGCQRPMAPSNPSVDIVEATIGRINVVSDDLQHVIEVLQKL